ncbi:unnamed protein product [Urochloa decumbens]|uniref:Translation elongation factor EF1B beta/delta subunit guanine nucleotide exchange domain-containing protein n=1 Tax=Urochloa decumbens TaxID=240449 RepID=A0ABC9EPI6_9POAL
MAVTFSDLHTADGLKALETHLAGKTYVSGDAISKDDVKVFAAVLSKPGAEFPNAARWYETVSAALASRFPGKAVGVNLPGAGSAPAAPAAEAAKDDDDDDLDLFGDETEDDKKAAEERAAAKASAKKKESGKSSVLMDVKPWDDETDMKKLEEAVRSVQMEGLTWGACKELLSVCVIAAYLFACDIQLKYFYVAAKLVPVGYGIKKMTIMLTIVDDLVSVDSLIEDHLTMEPINEYVQSCDIVAFNKI